MSAPVTATRGIAATPPSPNTRRGLRALLIGIEHYFDPPEDLATSYPDLGGCVHDVQRVASFLVEELGMDPENLWRVTSTAPTARDPEPRPTYQDILQAWNNCAAGAQPGDSMWIYYSGHGGRTSTLFPELKGGEEGIDEAIVPADIGRADARYLRDVEIGFLLEALVCRGIRVTVVLDCCHAGGLLREPPSGRAASTRPRSHRVVDRQHLVPSLVAHRDELAASWHRFSAAPTPWVSRDPVPANGWFPRVTGYVLLAACHQNQLAHEYQLDEEQAGGLFTHWLLVEWKALVEQARSRPELEPPTYRHLHDRLRARFQPSASVQTPQFEGVVDRQLLGAENSPSIPAIQVLRVEGSQLVLNTGEAHGMRRGARFAIEPALGNDEGSAGPQEAAIEVLGGVESQARLLSPPPPSVRPGDRALPLDLGRIRLRHAIRLAPETRSSCRRALREVATALGAGSSPYWVVAADSEPREREVAIDARGGFEIRDARGKALPNLEPALDHRDPGSLNRLLNRLDHLARYHHVEDLFNDDPDSPLRGSLELELGLLPTDYTPGRPIPPATPVLVPSTAVDTGRWLLLTLRNRSRQPLFLTVLDLQPSWSVSQLLPTTGDNEILEPGRTRQLPLQAQLPPKIWQGADLLKVFGTVDAVRFRWLELPPLDHPRDRPRGPVDHALEALMVGLTGLEPTTDSLLVSGYASREWTVEQVRIQISHSPSSSVSHRRRAP